MGESEIEPDVKGYLTLIDRNFLEAKNRISRMDLKWGIWSGRMNRGISAKIKAGGLSKEHITRLQLVSSYWQTMSILLELHYKSRLGFIGRKKRLKEEASEIKKAIMEGVLNARTD